MSRPRSVWSELRHWLILWHRVSCVKIDFMVPREALQKDLQRLKEVVRTSSWLAWFLVDVWANSIFLPLVFLYSHFEFIAKRRTGAIFNGLRGKILRKNRTGVNTRQHFHVCCAPRHPLRAPRGVRGAEEKPSFLEAYLSCSLPSPRNSPTDASGHTDINIISHLLCILCILYAHNINVYYSSLSLQKCCTALQ